MRGSVEGREGVVKDERELLKDEKERERREGHEY